MSQHGTCLCSCLGVNNTPQVYCNDCLPTGQVSCGEDDCNICKYTTVLACSESDLDIYDFDQWLETCSGLCSEHLLYTYNNDILYMDSCLEQLHDQIENKYYVPFKKTLYVSEPYECICKRGCGNWVYCNDCGPGYSLDVSFHDNCDICKHTRLIGCEESDLKIYGFDGSHDTCVKHCGKLILYTYNKNDILYRDECIDRLHYNIVNSCYVPFKKQLYVPSKDDFPSRFSPFEEPPCKVVKTDKHRYVR
jgi:hypothetical protein